jgi:hypothetical protein
LTAASTEEGISVRGFVIAFDTESHMPVDRDPLEERLARWQAALPDGGLQVVRHGRCRVFLFSTQGGVSAQFNQRARQLGDELLFWTGPRVDITDLDALRSPPHDLADMLDAARSWPSDLDTAVCVSYREGSHSLAVRTDILNATYVYTTQTGRWHLLSNSSLVLARLTDAGVNWVAASEFIASGSIYGNCSLYDGIRTLRPATVHLFKSGAKPDSLTYWNPDALKFNALSADEACERVVSELDRDFQLLNASGKTFILDLTGGYDSRANLGFALRKLKNFETTVTGRVGDEDVVLSSALAHRAGIKHTVIETTRDDSDPHRRLSDAALLTDCEYDILEYARIRYVQTRFDTLHQPSLHGSGGGDLARNIILRRDFYQPDPEGRLVLEPLIAQRFRNSIPKAWSRSDRPIADWEAHMRARIAEYDVPELPAFARLDIIYLRMRMQFWQARISSSTNRFRSSFSPWTNRHVLDAMLSTRWRDRRHQRLSRLFLRALHPSLSRTPVARGEPAGPDAWSVVAALPARMRYYAGRIAIRLGRQPVSVPLDRSLYQHTIPNWEEVLANILNPAGVQAMMAQPSALNQQVLGRLVTLAHVREKLSAL